MKIEMTVAEFFELIKAQTISSDKQLTDITIRPKREKTTKWCNVPSNWKHSYAPNSVRGLRVIEVKLRNGEQHIGFASSLPIDAWVQDGKDSNIVKFRPLCDDSLLNSWYNQYSK